MSRRSELPVIGITTYREEARWGVWDTRADILHAQYADAVVRAGGVPVLLPPASGDAHVAHAVVARLDALVISGGADVDPAAYGAPPHERTSGWRPDRDAWEVALLEAADTAGLPVLGVCRGMQVMAVAAGGTLQQHLPDEVAHDGHSPGGDEFGDVRVTTAEGSRLRSLVGDGFVVGCHHHQAVETHPSYDAVAWAEDGSLEAMERPGDRLWLGVQWHPEVGEDAALFSALVAAARG